MRALIQNMPLGSWTRIWSLLRPTSQPQVHQTFWRLLLIALRLLLSTFMFSFYHISVTINTKNCNYTVNLTNKLILLRTTQLNCFCFHIKTNYLNNKLIRRDSITTLHEIKFTTKKILLNDWKQENGMENDKKILLWHLRSKI